MIEKETAPKDAELYRLLRNEQFQLKPLGAKKLRSHLLSIQVLVILMMS